MGEMEPGPGLSETEIRRLHEANEAAARFFRHQLLRAGVAWPAQLLREWGVEELLAPGSSWMIGYAPDGWNHLRDHLLHQGFRIGTLMLAGLTTWSEDGEATDRYRDQLVVLSRDRRLDPVGFVGIDRDGQARPITPRTVVHRPLEAFVGLLEQIDLLESGATAVLVDHPLDAMAIDLAARRSRDQGYVGVPLLGAALSNAQVQILRQYSVADRVIVSAPPDGAARDRAGRNAADLRSVFDDVRLLQRGSGSLLADPGRLSSLPNFPVAPSSDDPSPEL